MSEEVKFFGENRDELLGAAREVSALGNARSVIEVASDMPQTQWPYLPNYYPEPFPPYFQQMEGFGVSNDWVVQTFDSEAHLTEVVITNTVAPVGSVGRLVGVQFDTTLAIGWCDETTWLESELVRTWERAMDQISDAWMAHFAALATWLSEHPEPSVDNEAVAAQIIAAVDAAERLLSEWKKVRKFKIRGGKK